MAPPSRTSEHSEQQLCFESLNVTVAKQKHSSGFLGQNPLVQPFKFAASPYEYKVIALRECPTPDEMQLCDTPERVADYWKRHIATHPHFNPECECFAVLLLNARRRVKGHQLVSTGTLDSVYIHPREVFRLALITAASGIILAHNHPSGESNPSSDDVRVTRDLIRAGQLMKIEVIDHIVVGNPCHTSLRDSGYFSM